MNESLDITKLLAITEQLADKELRDQKQLIKLIGELGFIIMISEYGDREVLILPKSYSRAMREIQKEKGEKI